VPEDNRKLDVWDCFVILALFTTAVLLPFEVALLHTPPRSVYIVGKIIDTIFFLDMLLTFNIAYSVANQNVQDNIEQYERSPWKIARHYMAFPFTDNMTAGWFWPDCLTVIPWEEMEGVATLSSVRLVRVLRLIRMLRLVRVVKLFKNAQTRTGFPFYMMKVVSCGICTLMLVHWLTCTWAHLGIHPPNNARSWLDDRVGAEEADELTALEIYRYALYFCTVVLTTVGFGDLVPMNVLEVEVMTATILITGITWSWVLANIVSVITNMDIFLTHFNQIMDDLNSLMAEKEVNKSLRHKVRRHMHESYYVHRRRHHQGAIEWLSAGLQGQIAVQSGVDRVLNKVWYFRELQEAVLIEIAHKFKGTMFSPNELIMDLLSLSVIMRGSCIRKGKIFGRDSIIGEDMILISEFLRDTSCPRTLTYLETMSIHRDKLKEVCLKFPDFDRRLRRAQVRLAVWRCFVITAHKVKKNREKLEMQHGNSRISKWETMYFQSEAATKPRKGELARSPWTTSLEPVATLGTDKILTELSAIRQDIKQAEERQHKLLSTVTARVQEVETALNSHVDNINKRFIEVDRTVERISQQPPTPQRPSTPQLKLLPWRSNTPTTTSRE